MRPTLILLLFSLGLHAQDRVKPLARKASLGVMLEAINDSISQSLDLSEKGGVLVVDVMNPSTAMNCGVAKHDLITEINGHKVNSIPELISQLSDMREGNDLALTVNRSGNELELSGTALARPKETSSYGEVKYGVVEYEGNRLRTILHLPHSAQSIFPVVYFIQGYPCQSVDLAFAPDAPSRKLIDDWVKAGYAVYRIEKPGMGDSESAKPCSEINFEEEIEVFRQGYKGLVKNEAIDPNRIFLFGHSIGGIIAPVIASEFQPKGVITYGTVVNTWFEYMQELTRVQGALFNQDDQIIENDIRNATPFWYELLVEQKSNTELLKDSEISDMLQEEGTLESFKQGYFIDRHYTYWSGVQKLHLTAIWSEVESNVLALYGECDVQALNANHIYAIERIVNRAHDNKATAAIIQGADHGFVEHESMEANIQRISSGTYGQYTRAHYHPGIAETTVRWMDDLSTK